MGVSIIRGGEQDEYGDNNSKGGRRRSENAANELAPHSKYVDIWSKYVQGYISALTRAARKQRVAAKGG